MIFAICMIPLSLFLRKVKTIYEWYRKEFKLNHLDHLHDDQTDSLLQTGFIFSEDIGIEFGLKKCGVVILKKVKLVKFDGIHLPSQEIKKEVDENRCTYFSILELHEIKEQ